MKKRFSDLITSSVIHMHGDKDVLVTGLSSDSRHISAGNIFFAVPGEQHDGNKFIPLAIKNGASVIVSEKTHEKTVSALYVQVTDIAQYIAEASALFYETIDTPLVMIGVTGTNGKTTTAHFINEVLKSLSIKTVFIGTIGIEVCGEIFFTDFTTPPAFELHRILRQGLDRGATYVVMEVSSHALKFKRVWGLQYDVAVFTNLTHEHREIHPTMTDYFQTKLQLFQMVKKNGFGIINTDDEYGKQILRQITNITLVDYGYHANKVKLVSSINTANRGQTIHYAIDERQYVLDIPVIGAYNAFNTLAAVETLVALGFDRLRIHELFLSIRPVPGRLEWYNIGGFQVIIDFAHTPDGLEKLIQAVQTFRKDVAERIITIFGCPGSRDPSKRPLMGIIATDLSDQAIITSDDIHHEEPDKIIADIVRGLKKNNFKIVVDRREAIARGLQMARKGDFLVIAGRGHEKYQYVMDQKIPFLDKDVLIEEAKKAGLHVEK